MKRDYSARQVESGFPDWYVFDIRDGRRNWTAQVALNPSTRRFWLLIEPGVHAHSLRVMETYDDWIDWLNERNVTLLGPK